MQDLLQDGLFDLQGKADVSEIMVNEKAANNSAEPLVVHIEVKEKKSASAG
jgi:hypothetical protein